MSGDSLLNKGRGRRGFFGRALCAVLCLGAGWAVGELAPEELTVFGEDPGVEPADLSAATQGFRETWQRYTEGRGEPGKLDSSLKKLVAQAFWHTPELQEAMKKLESVVNWQQMPDANPDDLDILPSDVPARGRVLGSIEFDAATLPIVLYKHMNLGSGDKLTILQNLIPTNPDPRTRTAWRSRGDLYAAMVSGSRVRMAAISGYRGERLMDYHEPIRLLDVIETKEAGPVVAYIYGPVGNGDYAYLFMRSWHEKPGCWEYIGDRGEWDDVGWTYDKPRKLLTINKMNSSRWGGNGQPEYQTLNLEQEVKEAARKAATP